MEKSNKTQVGAQSLTDQIDLLGLVYNTQQIDEFVETGFVFS